LVIDAWLRIGRGKYNLANWKKGMAVWTKRTQK
jgi:hypothetical protein